MLEATPRFYRYEHRRRDWTAFQVKHQQTDLWIRATGPFHREARLAVLSCRRQLENYIAHRPEFTGALTPLPLDPLAPALVRKMLHAARETGVGPMAAVAGAIAQEVATKLRSVSSSTIVENGGDCYLDVDEDLTVGIYAGRRSPFKDRLALHFQANRFPLAICTSSGTIGHSLSLGRADAVTVVAENAALADAAATAIGNQVRTPADLDIALDDARRVDGLDGILIVIQDKIAIWGKMELTTP